MLNSNLNDQYLERPLPSSEDSERVILGAILLDNALLSQALEKLQADDFYQPLNRQVFSAMISLFEHGRAIDPILIGEELRKEGMLDTIGGISAISNLTLGVPHATNIDEYVRVVREKSVLRSLIRACNSITSEALEQDHETDIILDRAEQAIFNIAEGRTNQSFVDIETTIKKVFENIKERSAGDPNALTGLSTGFRDLDDMTSGLQRSDLIIVAGRPSMGKTAFCLNVAQNAALRTGAVVAIFSLEMSRESLVTRMLASEARINAQRFRTGRLMTAEIERLGIAVGSLSRANIHIDDSPGISVLEMRAKCRRLAAEQKALDLVVVDYLQLMGSNRRVESRQQEVSQISRELKALAKELDVPVVALSQLSRAPEARNPPRPVMSDLRDSGSIEQDADIVAFIYRDDYYNHSEENQGQAELIIAKQRNGPTGDIKMAFLKDFTRFEDLYRG
ncbi:MAG: replicative DNA helicase [Acidobacteriota bacterium]|nr:MAG: replicative DNA helicase [Acidobacteriota bacterium]